MRRQSADRSAFSVGASDGSLIVIAGEPTRTSTSPSRAKTRRTYAGSTLTRVRRDTATTASRASGPRYHPGYYSAYVFDPDGNNIEVVNHCRTAI